MYRHLALICLLSSCSAFIDSEMTIGYDSDYPWIAEPTELAIEFWADHGIDFVYTENSPDLFITVNDLPEGIIGHCRGCLNTHDGSGFIEVDPLREDRTLLGNKCLIAHEIGHSLGMEHVSEPASLMSIYLTADLPNNNCFWSIDDQEELERFYQ
jgi:Matrixin